jgi:hypothetical protein
METANTSHTYASDGRFGALSSESNVSVEAAHSLEPRTLHVAITGDDSNDGSASLPTSETPSSCMRAPIEKT